MNEYSKDMMVVEVKEYHRNVVELEVSECNRNVIVAELHARAKRARGRSPIAKGIYPSKKIW